METNLVENNVVAGQDEAVQAYTKEEAIAEAKRCLLCKAKPCVAGCSLMVQIPDFIGKVAKGDFEEAYQVISASLATPESCPQEAQCEKFCIKARKGAPIAIDRLREFVVNMHNA